MSSISTFFIAQESNNYHPPALSYKAFLAYGILILILRLILGVVPAGGAGVESSILMLQINEERVARNLSHLTTDTSLLLAANQKAQDMIDRDYFAHENPDGNFIWPTIIAAGYGSYQILGENLAVDFLTAEGMIRAWLDSPSHRDNMLHRDFLDQGLAALYGDYQGRYTNLTASLFGARQNVAPPPPKISLQPPASVAPAPPPAVESTQTPPPAPDKETEETTTDLTPLEPSPQPVAAPPNEPAQQPPHMPLSQSPTLLSNLATTFNLSRVIFTIIGLAILTLLAIDSVIIHRHEVFLSAEGLSVLRSHSSYHLTSFMIITLISILIWWW